MKPAIEVNNVSKSYKISHQEKASYDTIKDDFAKLLKKPFGGGAQAEQEIFWALKDINFEINQGESFGIVGENGSGKSTLLKILSRIVDPTTGSIKIHGKVASLLEVGTGFHPELTGRENIYFNGSMIGMSKHEITRKFNEIVDFSGVEQFLDTPVKFYSSGMFVRLAFSVAAHLDSEILILDEVLSVGDAKFQKKSLGKMMSIVKEGRTIIFVSHSMSNVKQICNKAMLLDKGKIKYIGESEFVTDQYLSKNLPPQQETHFKENPKKRAQILSFQLETNKGEKAEVFDLDQPWSLALKYKISEPCPNSVVTAEILTIDGNVVFFTSTGDYEKKLPTLEPGTYSAKISFDNLHFVPGSYYLRITIQSPGKTYHDMHENFPLKIRQNPKDPRSKYFEGKYMGFLSNKIEWQIEKKGRG